MLGGGSRLKKSVVADSGGRLDVWFYDALFVMVLKWVAQRSERDERLASDQYRLETGKIWMARRCLCRE